MNLARLNGPEELFEARDEIAATLCAEAPESERTLIFRLLARSFADEYAGAILEARRPAVAAWAEEMCAKPGRAKAVTALFEAAQTLHVYLTTRGLPEKYLAPLPALGEEARAVVSSERERVDYTDHFDEVDAAIGEALSQLETADPRAAAHARNVSSWSVRLARRLGLGEHEVRFSARAGSLHELGTFDGALAPFADVARTYQGVLDTQGSLSARIVAVACAFNSAITGFDDRPAQTQEAALDQIIADVGTRFDVVVVAALHELITAP